MPLRLLLSSARKNTPFRSIGRVSPSSRPRSQSSQAAPQKRRFSGDLTPCSARAGALLRRQHPAQVHRPGISP